jgi:putative lipoprotein
MQSIHGEIVLPPDAPTGRAGEVVVELRDVTLLDAPSRVIAEQRLRDVPLHPGGRIPFRLEAPEVPPGGSFSVRAHVDIDGSGRVAPGDFLTTTSHPVPAGGPRAPMTVRVGRV